MPLDDPLRQHPRAASTNWMSFRSTSAWSGVLVEDRRATQTSRFAASKSIIDGGGEVRFQKVYMLRRCKASPVPCG